jgi:tRNA pseudouridine32 synthase/23S rRNA pseudouridine746 synthase
LIKSLRSDPTIFSPFEESLDGYTFLDFFPYPFDYKPDPLSLLAAGKLQQHLQDQQEWDHNFGLSENQEGIVIGKMFGVLVVRTRDNQVGYLSAFSGKLAGSNHHAGFVPPIFDGMANEGFLNGGMTELTRMSQEILLHKETKPVSSDKVRQLEALRKAHSISLQNRIFDQYHFLNQAGQLKSLRIIFESIFQKNPPAGAGECAAPKLLQYAFQHQMQPIAMAEFWWGLSPKSDFWKHKQFYPACKEKCEPILTYMLAGMKVDEKP